MNNKLVAEIGVFWINTVCTLRCERCITLTPYHVKPQNFNLENIQKEIDMFFKIYEKIEHFDIEGGESLLHPELNEIIIKALEYKTYFKRLHILTNGTVIPDKKVLEVCKGQEILFIIDDYGSLSNNKEILINTLNEYKIKYRVDKYHGQDQYCEGWVDFGDFSYKNYSDEQLEKVFGVCRQAQIRAPYIKDGSIFLCSIQAARLQHIELCQGEYVNLCNDSISLSDKMKIASNFGDKSVNSCKYCKGFDADNGDRYPAAQQLEDEIKKEKFKCL